MRFKTEEITSLLHIFESAELKKFVFVLPCWREYFDNSQWGRRKKPYVAMELTNLSYSLKYSSLFRHFLLLLFISYWFFFLSQMVQHDVEDTRWKHCVYWAEFTVEYRTVGENILTSTLIWVSRSNFTTNSPFTLLLRNVSKLFFFLTWPKIVSSWKLLTL